MLRALNYFLSHSIVIEKEQRAGPGYDSVVNITWRI